MRVILFFVAHGICSIALEQDTTAPRSTSSTTEQDFSTSSASFMKAVVLGLNPTEQAHYQVLSLLFYARVYPGS